MTYLYALMGVAMLTAVMGIMEIATTYDSSYSFNKTLTNYRYFESNANQNDILFLELIASFSLIEKKSIFNFNSFFT